jgi:hypothetical protein
LVDSFAQAGSDIQPIEANEDALAQRSIDLCSATFRPQLGECFASEGPNHNLNVSYLLTHVN